jgi:enolase-phosphatase E1
VTRSAAVIRASSPAVCRLASGRTPLAIVLDLEGTITPISFVRDTLFPYARERLPAFVRTHRQESQAGEQLHAVAKLAGLAPDDAEGAIRQLLAWSDADQKIPPLKALQGMIWEEGFSNGTFRAPLYAEVARKLKAWRASGIRLYIYSSGSVEAQKLLVRHTSEGDLSLLLQGYFDATIGSKLARESYRAIEGLIGLEAPDLLFRSDHPGEIRAARLAGWQAILIERDGPVTGREPPALSDLNQVIL